MEVLNENNGYINSARTQGLIKKWGTRISTLESVKGAPLSLERKALLATTFQNTADHIAYSEAVQSTDIGAYKRYALDMVGAVEINAIAPEVVSVQAINNRVGMINFAKYNYGVTKGGTAAGTTFADVRQLHTSDENYTSEVVEDEELASGSTTAHTGILAWAPIQPGTVKIVAGDVVIADSAMDGTLSAAAGIAAGATIDYSTGEYSFTLTTAATAFASYSYVNEHVPTSNLPEVTISIESLPVTAKTRRLAARWGFEAGYELQKEYGSSIEDLLSTTAASEIMHEIDMELLGDLKRIATSNAVSQWGAQPQVGVSQQDHFDAFRIKINEGKQAVYQKVRKATPNFMVCGTSVLVVVTSIKGFTPSGQTAIGPYFAGTTPDGTKIYVSPDYAPTEYVLGYKGNSLLEAGYVYAPYMPITTTAMVQLEDMAGRKGWATMYGKRAVNSSLYVRGTITGLN